MISHWLLFDFTEKYRIPVLLRVTTRLAHSRSGVICKNKRPQNEIKLPENPRQFILLPLLHASNTMNCWKTITLRKRIETSLLMPISTEKIKAWESSLPE
jgi:TPP-dependent indolepyruvate ferredoxin oxidoreductase alpha subunit